MSLFDRLSTVEIRRKSNSGCQTCVWLETLPEVDRKAFNDWIDNGWSIRQLHGICSTDPDHPLHISLTALKNHLHDCRGTAE